MYLSDIVKIGVVKSRVKAVFLHDISPMYFAVFDLIWFDKCTDPYPFSAHNVWNFLTCQCSRKLTVPVPVPSTILEPIALIAATAAAHRGGFPTLHIAS